MIRLFPASQGKSPLVHIRAGGVLALLNNVAVKDHKR